MAIKKRTSKFIREYGMTIMEMARRYNCSSQYIIILHARGELHDFIKEQESKNKEALQEGCK